MSELSDAENQSRRYLEVAEDGHYSANERIAWALIAAVYELRAIKVQLDPLGSLIQLDND